MSYHFDEVKHVHWLNDKPLIGTTTALKIIAKPLTWWASGLACSEFGWMNTKGVTKEERADLEKQASKRAFDRLTEIKSMSHVDYRLLLDKAYRAHSESLKKSADTGTDMHSELEKYIKSQITQQSEPVINDSIVPFVQWANKNVKRFLFSEVHCYSEKMWVGGIADFAYIDKEDRYVLGDFKSHKEAYWTDVLQVAGYDLQLSEIGGVTTDGKPLFALVKPFDYYAIFCERAGLDKPYFERVQYQSAKEAFKSAVELYKRSIEFQGFSRE